jgi:hypothetical protein
MRETLIEQYLKKRIKEIGGKALKFVSPGHSGVPDRICLLPLGGFVFVEAKSPTGKTSALQEVTFKEFERLGHFVHIVRSKADVDFLVSVLKDALNDI